jgi:hypothetical protein
METEPFINAKSYAAIEKILPFLQYHTPSHRIGLELGLAARTVKNIVAFIEFHRIESAEDVARVKRLPWRRTYHASRSRTPPSSPQPTPPQPLQAKRRVRPRVVSP